MCGIVGMIGQTPEGTWGETHRLLTALLIAAESRGMDATGFLAATEPFKKHYRKKLVVEKQPLRASRFVNENSAWRSLTHQRSLVVIGHTRLATHGSSDNPHNLHPFSSHDGQLHLVHNGIVGNQDELALRHQLRLFGECDSECLLGIVTRHYDTAAGLRTCLREVQGSMAVAVYDHRKESVWLARNAGNPLWILRLSNERRWFFASTPGILLNAVNDLGMQNRISMLFPLASETVHLLTPEGHLLVQ